MAAKAETRLRGKIVKAIEAKYGEAVYVKHPHGSMYSSGLPDLIGCLGGTFFALEVKTPENRKGATKLQELHLSQIDEAGGYSAVVRSVDEALAVLAKFE